MTSKSATIAQLGEAVSASGESFCVHEWTGSGPEYLHVHHADDEAWHILEGVLTFRFADRCIEAGPGMTIFVPAGVAHTYSEENGPTRYLIILTPKLERLIGELQTTPFPDHRAVLRRFESDIVD